RDGREFGRPSGQQRCEPGPMLAAVDLGITDDSEGASHEQAAQIAVTLFADTSKPVPTSARVLLRHQPDPGPEVATCPEGFGIANTCHQSCGQQRTNARNAVEALARSIGAVPSHDHSIKV